MLSRFGLGIGGVTGGGSALPTIHVDSVSGSDSNDGKSPSAAKQTLAGVTLGSNMRIKLKRGSTWRETIDIGNNSYIGVIVEDYGSGALPIIDGADIIAASGWTQPNAGTYPNVWQKTITHASTLGGNYASVWEDGARLIPVADIATTNSTAGSFSVNTSADASYVTGTSSTILVHATGNGSPNSNGKVYEVAMRLYGISTGSNWIVRNIHTKRSAANNGSLALGNNTTALGCLAEDGTKHNVIATEGCALYDCIAWKTGKNPTFRSGWNGFVSFQGNGSGKSTYYERCFAIVDKTILQWTLANGGNALTGFYAHSDGGGGHDWTQHTYVDCGAKFCQDGFSATNSTNVRHTRSHTYGCSNGISLAQANNGTLTDCWFQEETDISPVRAFQGGVGTVVIDGWRVSTHNGGANGQFYLGGAGTVTITRSVFHHGSSTSGYTYLMRDLSDIAGWTGCVFWHDDSGGGGAVSRTSGGLEATVDNNAYGNGALDFVMGGGSYNDWTSYRAGKPLIDAHSVLVTADPFTSASTGDFTLTGASGLSSDSYGCVRFPTYLTIPADATLAAM